MYIGKIELTYEFRNAESDKIFRKLSVNVRIGKDLRNEIINSSAYTFIITGNRTDMYFPAYTHTYKYNDGTSRIYT